MKYRILTLAVAVVLVFTSSFAFYKIGFRIGENRALESMETPGISRPVTTDPALWPDSTGATPGQNRPDQPTAPADPTEPATPTEPTQPAVCQHEYVRGECVHCGALKPTDGLVYTLNEDGQSYTLTRGWIDTYYDYSVVIADVYEGLPVTAIGDSAFEKQYGNDHLTSVYIPDSVTSIGNSAFYGCRGLTKVDLPDSITSIGKEAFESCSALTTIYWSEKAVTLGSDVFNGTAVKEVHISSIEAWCTTAFYSYNTGYTSGSNNPLYYGAKLYWNGEPITDLVIPEGVTRIGDYAFYCYDDLKSVTIPDSVTTIGDHAFGSCDALTTVTMGNGVTTIGDYAFGSCDNLAYKRYDTAYYLGNESNPYLCLIEVTGTDISGCNIHKDTKVIGRGAFSSCQYLTSITLPDGLRSIGDSAFQKTGLTAITIPDSVTYIGGSVFYECTKLSEVTLPAGLTEIGGYMFYGCSSLKSIAIPEGVTTIGFFAFYKSGIKNIVIPEGVTTIETYAFYSSTLESVTLPASLTHVSTGAFTGYCNVKNVYITNLEAWCGIEFEDYQANPLWRGATLYLNGEAVTELVIPDGVTSINNYAFYGSKITSLTIPASVTSIGDQAFSSCSKLATITFAGTLEQWYAVALGENWKSSAPVKQVICKDGIANL